MSESPLKKRLTDAMKDAMRAKDKARLGTIRLILADCKRIEVDERIELDDARILSILDKMSKQRRDSQAQYEAADRADLADQEAFELTVIQEFLPAPLTDTEIDAMIDDAVQSTGAESMKDMGKLMGVLKPQLQGRADMAAVSKLIKDKLQ